MLPMLNGVNLGRKQRLAQSDPGGFRRKLLPRADSAQTIGGCVTEMDPVLYKKVDSTCKSLETWCLGADFSTRCGWRLSRWVSCRAGFVHTAQRRLPAGRHGNEESRLTQRRGNSALANLRAAFGT